MQIEERIKWILVLIHKANYVEGRTRLQKLAFLVRFMAKAIDPKEFYDDWQPGRYGPFSRRLAEDIDFMLKEELIGAWPVPNEYGYKVERYALKEKGRAIVEDVIRKYPEKVKAIERVVKEYAQAPLMELLYDIYHQFPKYARFSEIKAEVDRKSSYRDTILSEQYDEPDE